MSKLNGEKTCFQIITRNKIVAKRTFKAYFSMCPLVRLKTKKEIYRTDKITWMSHYSDNVLKILDEFYSCVSILYCLHMFLLLLVIIEIISKRTCAADVTLTNYNLQLANICRVKTLKIDHLHSIMYEMEIVFSIAAAFGAAFFAR